jgi:hypothetical protein
VSRVKRVSPKIVRTGKPGTGADRPPRLAALLKAKQRALRKIARAEARKHFIEEAKTEG